MPNYKRNDPVGWCGDASRGAALGRATITDAPKDKPVKLYLRRSYRDSGGYDRNGTYFGRGAPLYWVSGEDADGNEVDYMLRAYDRDDAKDEVRRTYPGATFYGDPKPGPPRIQAFEILNHGREHSQYFQGCGVAFTPYAACYTGCGDTPAAAYRDAVEQVYSSGEYDGDTLPSRPRGYGIVNRAPVCGEEQYYYVSIRVR